MHACRSTLEDPTCACGNIIETHSTRGDFHVEICSNCHPFFTGKQKLLDTAGRIERFRTRYATTAKTETKKAAEPTPAAKPAQKTETRAEKRAKANASKPKPAAAPAADAKPEEPAKA